MYNVHYNLDFSAGFVQRLAWKSSRWKHQRRHTLWSQLSTLLSVAIWYYIIHSEDIQEFKNGTLNTTRGIVIGLHPRRRIERTSMESLFSPHRQGQMEAVWAGDCRSSDDLDSKPATISSLIFLSWVSSPSFLFWSSSCFLFSSPCRFLPPLPWKTSAIVAAAVGESRLFRLVDV